MILEKIIFVSTYVLGSLWTIAIFYTIWISIREKEYHAAKRLILFFLPSFFFFASFILPNNLVFYYNISLLITSIFITLFVFIFDPYKFKIGNDSPQKRIDERNIMFSRALLEPGTERYNQYYSKNKDKEEKDDIFRKKPGLMSPNSLKYSPLSFAAADASFFTVSQFASAVTGAVAQKRVVLDNDKLILFLKSWAKSLGVVSIGITQMQDYHWYSTIGRGEDYGKKVTCTHPFGIAFTVEMNPTMMASAPDGPTVMESAQQYLNAGSIAIQLAQLLRNLGYSARAHIDGNYRVVAPLVARDAGLGEIGRMGLLMTPELGPRVRIGVVTTEIELQADERAANPNVLDFCTICKKCADICPSKAISFTDREEINGAIRWQINQEACFTYWTVIGTDCGKCIVVCPYSHENNLLHNAVRIGLNKTSTFRRIALKMDDYLYGRKPEQKAVPNWINLKKYTIKDS